MTAWAWPMPRRSPHGQYSIAPDGSFVERGKADADSQRHHPHHGRRGRRQRLRPAPGGADPGRGPHEPAACRRRAGSDPGCQGGPCAARPAGHSLPCGPVRGRCGGGGGRFERDLGPLHPPSAGPGRGQSPGRLLPGGPPGRGDVPAHRAGVYQPHRRPVRPAQDRRAGGGPHGGTRPGGHEVRPGGEPQAGLRQAGGQAHDPHGHRRPHPGEPDPGPGLPPALGAGPGQPGGGRAGV